MMTFTEQIQKILIDLLANQLENENQIQNKSHGGENWYCAEFM